MGGRKARLLVMGEALVFLHARRLVEAGFEPIVVAHPADRASIALDGIASASNAKVVASTEADQAGSLAVGVRALPPNAEVVLITPVDALPASEVTLRRMVCALEVGVLAVTPTYKGKRGHPVLVRRSVLDVYDEGRRPLCEVLASLGSHRVLLDTEDPHVITDLDDAESLLAATGMSPRFV